MHAAGYFNHLANELPYLDGNPAGEDNDWTVSWHNQWLDNSWQDHDNMLTTLLMDCCPTFGGFGSAGSQSVADFLRQAASALWDQGVENAS